MKIHINTYNRLPYLKRCIESFIVNTDNPEIVVWDDGSEDGTIQWLEEKGIEYRLRNGQGCAENRNEAMQESDGWVTLSVDDIWIKRGWDVVAKDASKKPNVGCVALSDSREVKELRNPQYTIGAYNYKIDIPEAHGTGFIYIHKDFWAECGGFEMHRKPQKRRWGYFGNYFLWKSKNRDVKRDFVVTTPTFSYQMDRVDSPLREQKYQEKYDYLKKRGQIKKGEENRTREYNFKNLKRCEKHGETGWKLGDGECFIGENAKEKALNNFTK